MERQKTLEMKLDKLKWMNFSGSSIIFLPLNLKKDWKGFYSEVDSHFQGTVDLNIDGKEYYINDDFDFDNPQTDYDKICSINKNHFTYKVGLDEMLAVSAFYDSFAWHDEKNILINGRLNELDENLLSQINWKDKIEWNIKSEQIILMNSCDCPLDMFIDENDFQIINLFKGKYSIEYGDYSDKYCTLLYKFTKIDT